MAELSSPPPAEMPRRAFLVVGTAALAAGFVTSPPARAHPAPATPAATVAEPAPPRPHATLLGVL